MHSLGMKLGPALKLRSVLAKRLGGPCPCAGCTGGQSGVPAKPPAPQTQPAFGEAAAPLASPAGSIARPSSVESSS